jgi:hypothetical protein
MIDTMIWRTRFNFLLEQGFWKRNANCKEGNVTQCMALINQNKIDKENGKDELW